ncbi:MAG: tyrosine-type recombinase/integrase [Candidatus Acidiferrales bacterium]
MEATGKRPAPTVSQERITIGNWQDAFIKNARSENISEETIRKYKLLFKQLLAFAQEKGIRFPSELDVGTLQEFRSSWKDKSLSKSKKQERLRSIFKFALARKWITENPALELGKIKIERTQQIPYTAKEMKDLWAEARKSDPDAYVFLLVLRFSGLRISDVCKLQPSSLQGKHLVLRTEKTGSPVKVLLPDVVVSALKSFSKRSPEYFFWNGTTKLSTVTDHWRTDRIKIICDKVGIKNSHPHRFRHTFAVELLKQGTPAGIVADLLGNTEQIVVKHYSAWIEARQKGLDEAVKKANGYHDILPVKT